MKTSTYPIHYFLLIVFLHLSATSTLNALDHSKEETHSEGHSSKHDCDPSKDIVLYWNSVMLDANAADTLQVIPDQPGPCRGSRAFAIVSVAVFDAWNSINDRYTPYLSKLRGYGSANQDAAISTAARDTLKALYPQQATKFESAYATAMLGVAQGKSKTLGVKLGAQVAAAILAERSNDNSNLNVTYQPKSLPGFHQPDPLHPNQGFYVPHWGAVDPFAIADMSSFLSLPPPALTSREYTHAFNEVKNLGGDGITTPTQRTEEQTIIGIFWGYDGTPGLGTPPRLYNQIVRTIAIQKRNNVESNARLFALVNVAMADAGIQCWLTKYQYEFWRPVIAIQQADSDGNRHTAGDPLWLPLGASATNGAGDGVNFTPPFPAYCSGHATFCTAALHTVANFYGTPEIAFSFVSDEFNGINRANDGTIRPRITRHFKNLDDAIWENAISRIYLGIHWRFDATGGVAAGTEIADEVFKNILRRAHK